MRIDWAIPCRYVEVHGDGATIVGAGADVFVVPQIPTPIQILFAVRFVGPPDEVSGQQHSLACRLFDPGGTALGEQSGQMATDVNQIVPGYLAELTVPMGVVLNVDQHGTYHVEFSIDDDDTVRVPIHVVDPSTMPGAD